MGSTAPPLLISALDKGRLHAPAALLLAKQLPVPPGSETGHSLGQFWKLWRKYFLFTFSVDVASEVVSFFELPGLITSVIFTTFIYSNAAY
jgi:hypothetical protein